MSTPEFASRRGALRFLGATLAVTALYIALDVIWFAATGPFVQRYHATREAARAPDADASAREMAEAARRSGVTATAAQLLAAWRLGHQLGLASQLDHAAAIMRSDWAARAAEQVLGQAIPPAKALGLDAVVPLRGRTMEQASSLARRIEADELGLAAQMERMGGGPLRHLFLAGMFSGKAAYTRLYTPLDDPADAPHIERHARLAGLPSELWQPVARPPGATAEARREAFSRAVQQLDATLQANGMAR
jgi:hypothetical protein